jgi:hypothetical protein
VGDYPFSFVFRYINNDRQPLMGVRNEKVYFIAQHLWSMNGYENGYW